jgi:hypothetical protein
MFRALCLRNADIQLTREVSKIRQRIASGWTKGKRTEVNS